MEGRLELAKKTKKIPIHTVLIKQFPLALKAITQRSVLGHEKYLEHDVDWQGFSRVQLSDYENALVRHIFREGEDNELELDHDIATAWNALAILEIKLRSNENQ